MTYTYGPNGRMATVADNRGTTTLAYESGCDRVKSVTDPVTGMVGYTYGVTGERLTMTLPGGGTWTYSYGGSVLPKADPNSIARRLTTITDDAGRRVDYAIDQFGPLKSVQFNQVFDNNNNRLSYCETDYTYDSDGANHSRERLTTIANTFWYKDANGVWQSRVLTANAYGYDLAGLRQSNQISNSAGVVRTESYGYDYANRLTSVNYGDGETQTYSFDAMGNRTQKVDNGVAENYTYNNANMLLTRGANSYTNDSDGNTLTGGGRTNTWDSQNRLAVCVYGSTTSTFTYSADGLRRRMVSGSTTTDYVLDASMFVRERRAGANYATYLVGPRGPEYRRDDTTGTVRWYSYDGLGSVVAEVDPNGALTASRSYDVYGSVRTSAGTSTSKHKFVGKLGHPSDDETGLIYMQARYMDPATGRFVSEDPQAHGTNWFIYASANPVNAFDPSGRVSWWLITEIARDLEETMQWVNVAWTLPLFTKMRWALKGVGSMISYLETLKASLLGQSVNDMGCAAMAADAIDAEGGNELDAEEIGEMNFKGTSAAYKIQAAEEVQQLIDRLLMLEDAT